MSAPEQPVPSGPDAAAPSAKRGRRNEARWNEILTAAGQVFAERGYSDTTIDDIAARVGLLSGSLYYYITSKEDLLFEWACRVHDRSLELAQEDQETAAADAATRLERLIDRWMEDIRTSLPSDAYLVMDQEVRRLAPERIEELRVRRHAFRHFVYEIFDQGIAEGSFDPELDRAVAFNGLVRLLWSTSQWFRPTGDVTFEEVTSWYKTFFLRGISVDPT